MKNTKLYKYTCVALLALCIISCQNDDSIPRRGKPTITIANKAVTVTAGETATFDLNVEYAVSNPINIRIDVLDTAGNPIIVALPTDGDATTGEGFYDLVALEDIIVPYNTWFESGYFGYGYQGGSGYIANFPAERTTLQINIETIQDLIPNNTKVVKLRLTSTSLLEAKIDEIVTINIENYVSDELITRLNWAGDYLESGEDPCDIDFGLDLDLELIYGGSYIQTSYSDCPEQLTILGSDPRWRLYC
ncbi:hypothetical protein N7U66_09015 [Lacinutrix neustonica]|uniref:DUF1735 domain-containing protein n=1 Tax=Lacinutrix neustonica TaxID=2980107 RepID=A0A9E8SFM5_9FLAO|nr:hypothetical protein [Lacinutrix neustonica]WAC03589.1 hypothetical protein N7U66_09015 [Lacinutrix neustonica]